MADAAVPAWARVSKEQFAEAERLKIPAAFENSLGMRFVLIPAGTFTMGSSLDDIHRDEDETAHEVTLTRPYYIQTTEVTNAQYRRFRAQHDSGVERGAALNGDLQPVVRVSHLEATAFGEWLGRQDGSRVYRLPTEAEWERACRAGTATRYWWGDSISTAQANYGYDVYGDETLGTYRKTTLPVGSLPANPWGLYEIHGNAREWCSDRFDDDLDYEPGHATDPVGISDGTLRVSRGGAWSDGRWLLRSSFRAWLRGADEIRSYTGLRVVADVAR